MPIDLQITYRDFPPPLLAEKRIRIRVNKLERLFPRIISCHVVAEESHRNHPETQTAYPRSYTWPDDL